MMPRALLSVYDKTGLVEFARQLADMGWELIASGGTAGALAAADIPALFVEQVTGAPEMLGGRVKTLHPAIHAAILARESDRDALERHGYTPIDMVVCNLYPFSETLASGADHAAIVESIDIGGVTLLRAAAKNHERVAVVCDPGDYQRVYAMLRGMHNVPPEGRARLAAKAFAHTARYEAAISAYFEQLTQAEPAAQPGEALPARLSLDLGERDVLRYGENPHQHGAFYQLPGAPGPLGGLVLGGNKQLSYNNLLDLDAAWRAAELFDQPAVVIVKHLNPCGVAVGPFVASAFSAALQSDPVSAFGGVIALNRAADEAFVESMADLFVEAIAAPEFTPDALDLLARRRKNCRLVQILPESARSPLSGLDVRSVRGGLLVQSIDQGDPADAAWRVVTKRQPSREEMDALRFAWKAAQAVKSNAIVFAAATADEQGFATVGIGGGLPSRVDAARLAAEKAGDRARGAVMASDAFFPFADGLKVGIRAGAAAAIAPGGSVRDDEVIAAA
ncbi:MAG: bifunctional phosphoribosylaminoimidazolecarboxamide formyltransferase/IMP cyclohydrolase, partial [Anaerolineae bacterium]|nr:bifunctional phosphoribosylaminoimidazolecarboxamide formyltransferase/IMP cyclohydrolase [Anaerolineae bacterium]